MTYMLPSTITTASATQIMTISMLISSGHTHRYRRFAGILADHYARLAEICVSVKLHIAGLAPATLLPVSLAHDNLILSTGVKTKRMLDQKIRSKK